jgi:hypothetical protein
MEAATDQLENPLTHMWKPSVPDGVPNSERQLRELRDTAVKAQNEWARAKEAALNRAGNSLTTIDVPMAQSTGQGPHGKTNSRYPEL